MSPLRILIIAILLYIGYRLIFGGNRKSVQGGKKKGKGSSNNNRLAVEDVLVEDPVCHTLVPKKQAVHLKHEKEMVYFCSEDCCDKFIKDKGDRQ